MFEKKSTVYLYIFILFILLGVTFFFGKFFNDKKKDVIELVEQKEESDLGKYEDLGINPNDFPNIKNFLEEYKNFSGAVVDISKEDFVICKKSKDGSIIYTPFYQNYINGGLLDSNKNKNEAIVDIFESISKDCLFGGYNSSSKTKIIFEQDVEHNDTYVINDIFTGALNINDIINELEKTSKKSLEKKELLAYLYDLKGDYISSSKIRKKTCLENKITCNKKNLFSLSGKVLNQSGIPIPGAQIEFLNTKNKVFSDKNGNYSFNIKLYPFSYLKFKVSKSSYLDGFKTFSFNNSNGDWKRNEQYNFLLKSISSK